jgi:hypothetical protein
MRKNSYSSENETRKVDQYFECFNSLSNDCLAKINSFNESQSLTDYYKTTFYELHCNYYEYRFDLSLEAVSLSLYIKTTQPVFIRVFFYR